MFKCCIVCNACVRCWRYCQGVLAREAPDPEALENGDDAGDDIDDRETEGWDVEGGLAYLVVVELQGGPIWAVANWWSMSSMSELVYPFTCQCALAGCLWSSGTMFLPLFQCRSSESICNLVPRECLNSGVSNRLSTCHCGMLCRCWPTVIRKSQLVSTPSNETNNPYCCLADVAARRELLKEAKHEAVAAAAASLVQLKQSVVVALSKLALYKAVPEPQLSWLLAKLVTLLDGQEAQVSLMTCHCGLMLFSLMSQVTRSVNTAAKRVAVMLCRTALHEVSSPRR